MKIDKMYLDSTCNAQARIINLDSVDSTNTYVKSMADDLPEGSIVVADSQSAGRGRHGRVFHSVPGGLYMSILLRPKIEPSELSPLTICTAVLVSDAIEELCGFRPHIKWPNDLTVDGKKLCGILTELSLCSGEVNYTVIGIGINLNTALLDFPEELRSIVTSTLEHTGKTIDRMKLASLIAGKLAAHCGGERLPKYSAKLIARCKRDCVTLGSYIRVGETGVFGRAVDINASGALVIERPDGSTMEHSSGEVFIQE